MLIAYSTLPGYVANRDHFRGTWFIESICKVGGQINHNDDLISYVRFSWRERATLH